jgi:hypothetical protein
MSTPDPVPVAAAAIPWYQSRVQIAQVVSLVSAAIAMFPKVGTALGLTNLVAIQTAVETIFGTVALIAPLVGSIWRARSTLQPLTLTKAAAAVHPATIAVAAAQVANGVPHASPVTSSHSPNDKPAA